MKWAHFLKDKLTKLTQEDIDNFILKTGSVNTMLILFFSHIQKEQQLQIQISSVVNSNKPM
jgi:hypothetical protein